MNERTLEAIQQRHQANGSEAQEDRGALLDIVRAMALEIEKSNQVIRAIKRAAQSAETGIEARFNADLTTMKESILRLQTRLKMHGLDST